MNFLSAPVMYALAAVALAAGLFAGVQTYRLANERTAHAETKVEHARVLQDIANLTAKAAAEARAIERDWNEQFAAAAAGYHEDLTNAQATADRTVADLRDGNLRLQKQWRGCASAARVPGEAGSAGGVDGDAELRSASAGRIIGIGAQCDATIKALQAVAQ